MYRKVYSGKHTRLSDSQTKLTEGRMDRHVVGLTEEKTDEQRDIRAKHKQGIHTTFTVILIYRYITMKGLLLL